jgi:hypothetical protein
MTSLASAGLLLILAKAAANPLPYDIPYMEGGPREGDNSSIARIWCTAITADKISCTVAENVLHEPKADPAAKADFEKQIESKQSEAEFKKMCSNINAKPVLLAAPITNQLVERTKAACAARDASALWAALRWWQSEVEERTCKLSVYLYSLELSRVDANTWRSIQTGGSCGASATYTMSRKPGALGWVYDSIRTVPRSKQEDPLCKNPSGEMTETITYGKTYVGPREIRCRYWDAP